MKYLAMILLLSSMTVNAQSFRSLKDVMSDLGASFKLVTLGLKAGSITPKMVTESDNMIKYIIESESLTPDTILSLPNVDQAASKAKYDQEMKDLEKLAVDFKAALSAGDLALSNQILIQLGNNKKQGHSDYKN